MRTRSRRSRGLRSVVAVGLFGSLGAGLAVVSSRWHVAAMSKGRVHAVDEAPSVPIAMVLGAKADPGRPSRFLAARLDLAVTLWAKGRIKAVLVSGDGEARSNFETRVMRDYLVERGIPADRIVEDPAGFDTYDSCVRARDVFGVTSLVVLSQEYHVRRAVAICRDIGVDAVGVGDTSVRDQFTEVYARGEAREWLANLKMEWDLFTRRSPRQDPFDPALLEAAGLR